MKAKLRWCHDTTSAPIYFPFPSSSYLILDLHVAYTRSPLGRFQASCYFNYIPLGTLGNTRVRSPPTASDLRRSDWTHIQSSSTSCAHCLLPSSHASLLFASFWASTISTVLSRSRFHGLPPIGYLPSAHSLRRS